MSYGVDLADQFKEQLIQLPPEVAEHVLDEMERLATYPAGFSERSELRTQAYQRYMFYGFVEGRQTRFELRFQYSQDEQSIVIIALDVQPLEK